MRDVISDAQSKETKEIAGDTPVLTVIYSTNARGDYSQFDKGYISIAKSFDSPAMDSSTVAQALDRFYGEYSVT